MIIANWECPICFGKGYNKIEQYRGKTDLFRRRKLITCCQCTGKSIYPMPSERDLFYHNRNYWSEVQSNSTTDCNFYYAQAKARVDYINFFLKTLDRFKILDVGSGHAFIFDVLQKSGVCNFTYSAVESDQMMQKELVGKGVDGVYTSLNDIKDCKFDLIILSHIIEHIREPLLYLRQIKKLLENGGYMFIEVPNQDDYFKIHLESHLTVFNAYTLKKMVNAVKMEVIDLRCVGEDIYKLKRNRKGAYLKYIFGRLLPNSIKSISIFRKGFNKYARPDIELTEKYRLKEDAVNGRWLRLLIRKSLI